MWPLSFRRILCQCCLVDLDSPARPLAELTHINLAIHHRRNTGEDLIGPCCIVIKSSFFNRKSGFLNRKSGFFH